MKSLKSTTKKLSPAFRDFGEYLKKDTVEQFKQEKDPSGKSWQPLKPATLARKKTTTILRETLVMFNSFYYVATDDGFEYGLKDSKYTYHHTGTNRMPARIVIGINNNRLIQMNKLLTAQIRRVTGNRKQQRQRNR